MKNLRLSYVMIMEGSQLQGEKDSEKAGTILGEKPQGVTVATKHLIGHPMVSTNTFVHWSHPAQTRSDFSFKNYAS